MESAVALAAIALLGNKIIELFKYLRTKDWNGAITLLAVMAVGVIILALAANADVAETLIIPGTSITLGSLDAMSIVLLGLAGTSVGSTIYDYKKAFDGGDSAKQPPLTGASSGPSPT